MQIRTFSADKLHQALSLVRTEFGPDAMILDRNKARDDHGNVIWQVRAARDTVPLPASVREAAEGPKLVTDDRLHYSMQHLERIVSTLGRRESDALRQTLEDEEERRIFDALLDCGVAATHASELARPMAHEAAASAPCLRWGKRLAPEARRETVLISGPAGGGKTTMIANLATHFHLQGVNVALVSTDTERMAGIEGLAAYASVLGVELHPMRYADEAPEILQKTESARLLLIDSEGWSQTSRRSRHRQEPLWRALSPNRHMLMLPANLDEADGMATLQHIAGLAVTDLVPGKLDETAATGKVINWAAHSGLPLSYCSFGPSVPDQMGWLTPKTLATLLQRKHHRERT